jgi:hypothetical protein
MTRDCKCSFQYYKYDCNGKFWLYKPITIVNDTSRVMLQIVDLSRGIIYDRNMFIEQDTEANVVKSYLCNLQMGEIN